MPEAPYPQRILRRKEVESATGCSRSTIYLRISQGLWPKPVCIGPRSVGWLASEVQAMNAARVAGRTDDQIRELVSGLERARVTVADPC
jgi:prophage regulatory protein